MCDEQARRRPRFQQGIALRLADGQVWSFPRPITNSEDAKSQWNDASYNKILQAIVEASNSSELFHAKMSLAIHLLDWNYALDANDYEQLFDDGEDHSPGLQRMGTFDKLARAHIGWRAEPATKPEPSPLPISRRGEVFRFINQAASRILG